MKQLKFVGYAGLALFPFFLAGAVATFGLPVPDVLAALTPDPSPSASGTASPTGSGSPYPTGSPDSTLPYTYPADVSASAHTQAGFSRSIGYNLDGVQEIIALDAIGNPAGAFYVRVEGGITSTVGLGWDPEQFFSLAPSRECTSPFNNTFSVRVTSLDINGCRDTALLS